MDPGKAQNGRNASPTAEVTTVGFVQGEGPGKGEAQRHPLPEPERTAGVEGTPSQDPALPPPYSTIYCYRHNALEAVEGVEKVRPFIVEERGLLWPNKTNRSACEVWGFTTAGCGVHFIGGPKWNR